MTEEGYLRVGCRNHGIVETEITSEEKAEQAKQQHLENTDCHDYEIQVQDIGFYDHSSRKPDDADDVEQELEDILSGGENQ